MAPAHDVTYCSGSSVEVFSILSGGVRFWKHHSGGVELDLLYILGVRYSNVGLEPRRLFPLGGA